MVNLISKKVLMIIHLIKNHNLKENLNLYLYFFMNPLLNYLYGLYIELYYFRNQIHQLIFKNHYYLFKFYLYYKLIFSIDYFNFVIFK